MSGERAEWRFEAAWAAASVGVQSQSISRSWPSRSLHISSWSCTSRTQPTLVGIGRCSSWKLNKHIFCSRIFEEFWRGDFWEDGFVPLQANEGNGPDGRGNQLEGEARREVDEDGGEAADELLQQQHDKLVFCWSSRAGEGRRRRGWSRWAGHPSGRSWSWACDDPDRGWGDGQNPAGEEPVDAQDVWKLARSPPSSFTWNWICVFFNPIQDPRDQKNLPEIYPVIIIQNHIFI